MKYGLLFMLACVWVSCNSPKTKADTAEMETKADQEDGLQIGDYVVETFQDSQGNLWLGRDGYGASKFDGTIFAHFTINEGLNSNNVQSIVEDKEGIIWIGTRVAEKDNTDVNKRLGKDGLNKYDGEKFIHFPEIEGLNNSNVFTLYYGSAQRAMGSMHLKTINLCTTMFPNRP